MRRMRPRAVKEVKAKPMPAESSIHEQAISWHIRLKEGGAEDWDQFAEWLAQDARHAAAYDEVALADRELGLVLTDWSRPVAGRANDNWPRIGWPPVRRRWALGATSVAAAAAALLWLDPLGETPPALYDVSTAPGEQRTVALAGKDRIALNGATRLRLDRGNPRFASLVTGEAAFEVTHDSRNPFVLQVGDSRIVDVGTSFNVVVGSGGHRVEVAEGALLYNPDREAIALAAGQTLTSNSRERRITLSHKPPADVGGWQRGRLSYRSSSLSVVASDLSRSLGTRVSVQPELATRTFTGTIEIDRDESRMFARLARLLDVEASRDGRGWTLSAAGESER